MRGHSAEESFCDLLQKEFKYMKDINVALIGASGYTGLEIVKMLINHKRFNLHYVANTTGDTTLEELHPALKDVVNFQVDKADAKDVANECELAFLALPHKASMGFAKELLELGVKVVDLSADYRLELETYEDFYCEHEDKEHIKEAVYGLPEMYREEIKKTNLVANPGCYPTAALIPLLPFTDFIDEGSPIYIDAKTGVSGAGKGCKPITAFGHLNENFFAYSPLGHRHMPEIEEKLLKHSGKNYNILFVPQLLPITRGMYVSTFVQLNKRVDDPAKILTEYFKDEPFIRVRETPVDLKSVAGTNFCDIYADIKEDSLYLSSSIDNLLKGASSAAVANANIMFGLEEDEGIPKIAYVP